MANVTLHVYDVTNSDNDNLNTFIQGLNNVTREISAGGVFHGAIEVFDFEWSFGYCPNGSGVYRVAPRCNHMYQYRESIPLGQTSLSKVEFERLILQLQKEWPGCTYDLLQRNCNHFCEVLAARIGVAGIPGWVNRFAYSAEMTLTYTTHAYNWVKNVLDSSTVLVRESCCSLFGDRPAQALTYQPVDNDIPSELPGPLNRHKFGIPEEASVPVHDTLR